MSLKFKHTPMPPGWRRFVTHLALAVVLGLTFVLATGLLDGGTGVEPIRLFNQPRFLMANAWPGLLLAGVLLTITRRVLLSLGTTFLLQGVVYAVNGLKVANLGTPLLPADFGMLGQLRKGGLHLLSGYLPHSVWPYVAILVALLLIAFMWRVEPALFPRRTHGKRLLAGSVMAALLLSLLTAMPAWGKIYNGRVLWLEPWSASSTATHSGLISSLLMFQLQYGRAQPAPDRDAAMQLIGQSGQQLQQYISTASDSHPLPDIVVVQSESLFDPTIVRGFEDSNFTPNLRRLAAQGSSGALHVPTFGGGTIRTEFEVLTGLSLRYFDQLQFPYLQVNYKHVPSLVRVLNAHGYETVALHGNDPAFWNRTTAFKAIGFDRFVSRAAFPSNAAVDGKYMADSAMTDEILAQLKDAGAPQFIFAISIEAHGPYDVEPAHVAERDAIAVPDGIVGKDKLELQTYLYHLRHADAELGRLVKHLAERARPSLVLFYGDHLPALSGSYHTLGFVDGQDMLSQPDTWLLIDPKHPAQPTQQAMASWLLPGKLLQQAGIHDVPYFALTQLVGLPLAELTAAPGAPPSAEGSEQERVDLAMSSVNQLRLSGKLEQMLPKPTPMLALPHAASTASH